MEEIKKLEFVTKLYKWFLKEPTSTYLWSQYWVDSKKDLEFTLDEFDEFKLVENIETEESKTIREIRGTIRKLEILQESKIIKAIGDKVITEGVAKMLLINKHNYISTRSSNSTKKEVTEEIKSENVNTNLNSDIPPEEIVFKIPD